MGETNNSKSETKTQIIDTGAGRMVRSFFLKGRKTVIVDSGRPGQHAAILNALGENGIEKEDVSLIIITHGHEDHTGSVIELKEALRVPVAMSRIDAGYISRGLNAPLRPRTFLGRITTAMIGPKARAFRPDILIDDEADLSKYGVDAVAFPTPGHTAGSISIATVDACLTGDLLMGKYMVGGRPETPRLAEVPEAIVPSINKVLARKPALIYPSHWVPWRAEHVRQMLARLRD